MKYNEAIIARAQFLADTLIEDGHAVNKNNGKIILKLCDTIEWLVGHLDEADEEDLLGTEGWRHRFGVEE